jgi:molybdate transport system permease protein
MALEVAISKRLPEFKLDVEFVAQGPRVALLGASGAGKTMILRAIAGLVRPDAGRIVIGGRTLFDSAAGIHVPTRARRISLLFQHYALFPHLTVEENIAFGLRNLDAQERSRRVAEQIADTHLSGFERRYPGELSGGQQQRVALGRALAPQPEALLLDEPFSALDTHLRSQLERQLHDTLSAYTGVALIVSHNLEELYRLCGDIVVLEKGSVIASGSRDAIFGQPPNRATAQLTGCKNFSRARTSAAAGPVEALDWGCSLRVGQQIPKALGHVAIRAHHVGVEPLPAPGGPSENSFPGWVAAATEGPFRVTLYLRLNTAPATPSDYHLQVEITRERWTELKAHPFPWSVRLDPDRLFLLPD